MGEDDDLCQNCGEVIAVNDELYYCSKCKNQICEACLEICSHCKKNFCDKCFLNHKKKCK